MPTPDLPDVQRAADELFESVTRHTPGMHSLWQLKGVPTSGKSTCLALLADRLGTETELKPVIVSPPAQYLDAGPVALTDLVVGMASHGLLNGEIDAWQTEKWTWSQRLERVHEWVDNAKDSLVVLCDEPRAWGANRDSHDMFGSRSFQAAFALSALPCRRVVTGASLAVPVSPVDEITLTPGVPDLEWLQTPEAWGRLSDAVAAVVSSALLDAGPTALEVRLLIASTALTSLSEVEESLRYSRGPRSAVKLLADVVSTKSKYRPLWDTWHRLSLTRRPVTKDVLDELTSPELTKLQTDVVRHCLVYGSDEVQLHDVLRVQAVRWRREHQDDPAIAELVTSTTRSLFDIHRARFTEMAEHSEPEAITQSMEAFHFATESGDQALIDQVQPLFVEQLDALGWSLSYERGDFKGAVRAFQAAVTWDDEDDYAHHYLAYNLVRAHKTGKRVEAHYRRAIALNPSHPWWRSRLTTYLLYEGRIADAQQEWEDALLQLPVGDGDTSPTLYERLHCWVASGFLKVGELRQAREILDEVPAPAREKIEFYGELSQRVNALLELGDGPAVVPGWRLRPQWWLRGPDLLQHRLGTGEILVRWLACRVESKDEDGIHLRGAVLNVPQNERPRNAWTTLAVERFDALNRDELSGREIEVGTFVEVGLYADAKNHATPETLIRILPSTDWSSEVTADDLVAHLV